MSEILKRLPEDEVNDLHEELVELTAEEKAEILRKRKIQSKKVVEEMPEIEGLDDFYKAMAKEESNNGDILNLPPIEPKKKTKKKNPVVNEAKFKTLENDIAKTTEQAINANLDQSKAEEEPELPKQTISNNEELVEEEDREPGKVYGVQPKNIQNTKGELEDVPEFQFDLSEIEISDDIDPIAAMQDMETIFNNTGTFEVVAFQSGYKAELSALSMQDVSSIMTATNDIVTNRRRLYQQIHKHIESTSIGILGFNDWCKYTSFGDIETFLYGIYCQTFPTKNDFELQCPSCGKLTSVAVNNNTLISVANMELMSHRINEIRQSATKPADIIGKSLVHTEKRVSLPSSKVVADIKIPSIKDYLDLLSSLDQKFIMENSEVTGNILYLKALYMPDLKKSKRTGKPCYTIVDDKNKIINILLRLNIKDGLYLEKQINERVASYSVEYKINGVRCQHCKDKMPSTPVDLEKILFTAMDKSREEN